MNFLLSYPQYKRCWKSTRCCSRRRVSSLHGSSSAIFANNSNFEMKSVLVVTCLLLAVAAIRADFIDSYLEKAKDPTMTCGKENGFTEQTPRAIFDKDVQAGVDKATCLRACVMKSMGTMKDSKVNMEKMTEFIKSVYPDQPEMVKNLEKAAAECVDKVKDISDECKMAYSYVQCYLDKH